MSAMEMVADIRELTFDEVDWVSGGDRKTAGAYLALAGGTLGAVGTIATTIAMIPTPVSPMLATFGGVTRGVGAVMILAGSYYAFGGTFGLPSGGQSALKLR